MTPEQAADARRRKKEELERQLAALDEEDRYYRASQPPPDVHRHRDTGYNAVPSYPSRNAMVSPPGPQTAMAPAHDRRTAPAPSTSSSSRHRTVPSAFQPLPDPTPMTTASSSHGQGQALWIRDSAPVTATSSQRPNNLYTPSPDLQQVSHKPRMPNPFSASFINIPVPSREQVETYIIRQQGRPLGLRTGWTISNHAFDVYDLFVAVHRLGGSKSVSRRQWWPEMADILGIPGVNSPQGRNVVESGRQLCTFFSTHLLPLEDMWEKTSDALDHSAGPSRPVTMSSQPHLSRVRQPVSSTRGGPGVADDETAELSHSWTQSYPPQPPPAQSTHSHTQQRDRNRPIERTSTHASQSANTHRSSNYTSTSNQGSVPLHVNPTDLSLRRAPANSSFDNISYPRTDNHSQSHDSYSQPTTYPATSTSRQAQQTGASPVLHQPVPAALSQTQSAARLDQRASSAAQPSRSSPTETAQTSAGSASNTTTSASKSKLPTFPSLTNYNPPKFASFDHLVATNALTLPRLPPNVHLDIVGSPTEIYAKRCFELRAVIKKIQAKEPARQIAAEELTFWQKLLAILRHNPQVIIPGTSPLSTANAPLAPTQGTSASAASQPAAGPSAATGANGQTSGEPPKKRRGRPPKNPDADGNPQPRKRARKKQNPPLEGQSNGAALVARTEGAQGPAAAAFATGTPAALATTSASAAQAEKAMPMSTAPAHAVAGPSTSMPATTSASVPVQAQNGEAGRNGAAPASQPSQKSRTWTPRVNADGTPIPRKPYTIRINPDGTPVSDRFKARLSSGQMGHFEIVNPDSTAFNRATSEVPVDTASQPTAASLAAAMNASDADAVGEVDTSLAGNAIDVHHLARQVVQGTTPSQALRSTPNSEPTGKNPRRAEAMRARWQRVREEREAMSSFPGQLNGQGSRSDAQEPPRRGIPPTRGGFSVPGAAQLAAHKRWGAQRAGNPGKKWSLFHAGQVARASGRESTPIDLSFGKSARAASVKPCDSASASPRRIISLSGGPVISAAAGPSQTPTRFSASQPTLAGNGNKPRSSLPLFLSPAPLRVLQTTQSDYGGDQDQPIDVTDDAAYEEEMPPPEPRITRGASSRARDSPALHTRSRPAPRFSLPSLPTRAPPSSGHADKGKGVARASHGNSNQAAAAPSPPPSSIATRARRSGLFDLSPQQLSTSGPRSTRAASQVTTRPVRARLVAVELLGPSTRASQPPASSQTRSRLVPEVELPARARRLSSTQPASEPDGTRRNKPWLAGPMVNKSRINKPWGPAGKRTRAVKAPLHAKSKPNPVPRSRPRPKVHMPPKRIGPKEVRVVIPINRATRAHLIRCGVYDAFRDDDSDDETTVTRRRHRGLRKIALPRASMGRTARPTAPEAIPARFTARVGPALEEPFNTILDQDTILKRTCEHECQWKGCDAVLASEWHLRRHFDLRKHAQTGAFRAGTYGENTLYRCHWVECEKPCFSGLEDLQQHLTARHISRNIACPWPECGLRFTTLSHLTRHAVKHHDSPDDQPVPFATLTQRIPAEPAPDDPLPEAVRTDILMTPRVRGSVYSSVYRREWCRLKVQKGSVAPENPNLFPEHRPHMLETGGEDELADDTSDLESVYTTLDGGPVTQQRLLDDAAGRNRRRLEPAVVIRVRNRSKAGDYSDFFPPVINLVDNDNEDEEEPDMADDSQSLDLPDDDNEGDVSRLTERRARFDLSEEEDEDDGSESEVWAELEDETANNAYTPAGFPADFDFDQLDEQQLAEAGMNADGGFDYEALIAETLGMSSGATPGETYATPAAYFDFEDEDEAGPSGSHDQKDDGMEVDEEPLFLDHSEEATIVPDFSDELAALRAAGFLESTGLETRPDETEGSLSMSADTSDIHLALDSGEAEAMGEAGAEAEAEIIDVHGAVTPPESAQTTDVDDTAAPADAPGGTTEIVQSTFEEAVSTKGAETTSAVPDFAGLFGRTSTEQPASAALPESEVKIPAEQHSEPNDLEPIVAVIAETETKTETPADDAAVITDDSASATHDATETPSIPASPNADPETSPAASTMEPEADAHVQADPTDDMPAKPPVEPGERHEIESAAPEALQAEGPSDIVSAVIVSETTEMVVTEQNASEVVQETVAEGDVPPLATTVDDSGAGEDTEEASASHAVRDEQSMPMEVGQPESQ